jgi:hypothetical protein
MFSVMVNHGFHFRVLLLCKIPPCELASLVAVTLARVS